MIKKFIVIDGSSLLSSSFFGSVPMSYRIAKTDEDRKLALKDVMQTKDGIYTNGVLTMTKILLNLIEQQKPTHMAVAWDVSRNTFRRLLYKKYKAQREEVKPELKVQYGIMQEVLKAMNIPQFMSNLSEEERNETDEEQLKKIMVKTYEADDYIGSFVKRFEEEIPMFIMTKDQDALQLVSEHTRLWYITSKRKEMYEELGKKLHENFGIDMKIFNVPVNSFEYTPLYVKEVYGVEPSQIVDLKALKGDTSDNIPGVSGVGDKSVIPLLQEFGTIENLYDHIENMDKQEEKEMKEFFKSLGIARSPLAFLLKTSDTELVGKESAVLSKTLATIKTDIEEIQKLTLEELVLNVDMEAAREQFAKLNFNSLLKRTDTEYPF